MRLLTSWFIEQGVENTVSQRTNGIKKQFLKIKLNLWHCTWMADKKYIS